MNGGPLLEKLCKAVFQFLPGRKVRKHVTLLFIQVLVSEGYNDFTLAYDEAVIAEALRDVERESGIELHK